MRLLFFSNVFPSRLAPSKGVFNLGMVRALMGIGLEVEVIVPIAWTEWLLAPRDRRQQLRMNASDWLGVDTHNPVYFYPPGMLRGTYGEFMWRGVRRTMRAVIDRLQPAAILAYWAHPDGYCAVRVAREYGIPAVVMVGGSDVLLLTASGSRRRVIWKVLNEADAVVAVSADLRSRVIAGGVDRNNAHVVRRGIDTRRFCSGDRSEARRRTGLPAARPVLLWVGRMESVKGLPVLLDALRLLKQEGTDYEMVLVGSGSQSAALRAMVQRQGLAAQIRMPGTVPHEVLADYYRAADLTVLPSLSEGVPNVLLESIACGTPFVASRVGGVPEVATPGLDRLVPPGDPQALAAAIRQQLLSPPSAAKRTYFPDDLPAAAERLIDVIGPLVHGTPRDLAKSKTACLKSSIV